MDDYISMTSVASLAKFKQYDSIDKNGMMPGLLVASVSVQMVEGWLARVTGDPVAGERQFGLCTCCHDIGMSPRAKPGPNPQGIVGKKAGTADGRHAYSTQLKSSGVIWTAEELECFLLSPSKAIAGNKMAFAGVANAETRANIIAFLGGETSIA